MDQDTESLQEPCCSKPKLKSIARALKKTMQKTRSFTDALKEKYCSQETTCHSEFIIDLVIRGKPKNNGTSAAELAHLRNVILSNSRVSAGGLPDRGLIHLCPNVSDLDLSSNLLESWAELLPLLSQLPNLKFLNLSRNHITRRKEELWRWNTPLPKLENLVLNSTGVPLREVLALARLMPVLRELHICCNYYRDLGSVEVAIHDGALSKLECLRLNENIITSWAEVWKLRNLPCLTQLIMSENPLCDVFYTSTSSLDGSLCEMDSPDITCHSDGEDTSFGSPHFRYPMPKMATYPMTLSDQSPAHGHSVQATAAGDSQTTAGHGSQEQHSSQPPSSSSYSQAELIEDLLDELITKACQNISVRESTESAEHSDQVAGEACCLADDADLNQSDNRPQFYLDDCECGAASADIDQDREDRGQWIAWASGSEKTAQCERTDEDRTNRYGQHGYTQMTAADEDSDEEISVPFSKLHTLCLSRTSLGDMDHLQALNNFPALHSLRIMGIALFADMDQEDRRKLFVASLPRVQFLNGSEVTSTERDKAERHYLRHFMDADDKGSRYLELERKHGPIQPLFDIDLGAKFQTEVSLTFKLCGVKQFTETISVLQPVGKLRSYIARKFDISPHSFRMFHHACGPHQDPANRTIDELFLDSLPLSRFDFLDGDELHVEYKKNSAKGSVPRFSKREIRF